MYCRKSRKNFFGGLVSISWMSKLFQGFISQNVALLMDYLIFHALLNSIKISKFKSLGFQSLKGLESLKMKTWQPKSSCCFSLQCSKLQFLSQKVLRYVLVFWEIILLNGPMYGLNTLKSDKIWALQARAEKVHLLSKHHVHMYYLALMMVNFQLIQERCILSTNQHILQYFWVLTQYWNSWSEQSGFQSGLETAPLVTVSTWYCISWVHFKLEVVRELWVYI